METAAPPDPTATSPLSSVSPRGSRLPKRSKPESLALGPLATWSLRVAVVVLAIMGLGIRVWALGRHAINADQAVVGLMAEQILHGHFSAFYWGQSYGGGEPY